jgi:hypothetical protein
MLAILDEAGRKFNADKLDGISRRTAPGRPVADLLRLLPQNAGKCRPESQKLFPDELKVGKRLLLEDVGSAVP